MDYRILAENLIDLQTLQRQTPTNRRLSILEKGTFLALRYLMEHGRAAHPKELSREMAVSTARVSALLNHLEQEGLIMREPDPSDSRQIMISVTSRGKELAKNQKAEVVEILSGALEKLGPEEAELYLRIQRKLLQILRAEYDDHRGVLNSSPG